MSTAKAGVRSDPPTVVIAPAKESKKKAKSAASAVQKIIENNTISNPEVEKYIKCWDFNDYRRYSPGEELVDLFLELGQEKGTTIIDWGCPLAIVVRASRPQGIEEGMSQEAAPG